MTTTHCSQLHIALFAFPFSSHPICLLNVTQKQSSFLPSNTLFSYFNTSQSNTLTFSKSSKPNNLKVYDVWDGVKEGNDTPFGHEAIELFIQSPPANFEKSMKEAEEERGFPSSLRISDVPPEVAENLEGPVPYILYNMALNLHKAVAVVVNSFEELSPTINKDLKSKLQKVYNVGPLVLESSNNVSLEVDSDESGCIEWLDKQNQKSVVYISFGTITTLLPNETLAIADALEAKKVPFIWSLKDNDVKILPKVFLERAEEFGEIVSWAPQLEILAHSSICVHVSHGGWNSVLESISHGVPMICRPSFADQKLNSRLVESVWEIGLQIEGGSFTKSGTMSALDIFFNDDKGKVLRQNVVGLKARALAAVKPENGSSTQNFKALADLVKRHKLT
ncbi:Anthocyanidin 3-O-glucosyltransferase [Capsicum chinense]|nr:Anthocyanidin 3-O-glucosyltransferase [Capsicum chinense]